MTVATVRAELVAKLETELTRVSSFAPDSINPPAGFVGTMTYDPRAVLGNASQDMTAQVWVVVSRSSDSERAADALDAYIDGDDSLIDALHGTSTVWDSLDVVNVEFPITVDIGGGQYLAARFDCEIFT